MFAAQIIGIISTNLKSVLDKPLRQILNAAHSSMFKTEYVVPTIVRNFISYVQQQINYHLFWFQINYQIPQQEKESHEKQCPICLSQINNGVTGYPCKHQYCGPCILEYWVSKQKVRLRCPYCRKDIRHFLRNFKFDQSSPKPLHDTCRQLLSYNRKFGSRGLEILHKIYDIPSIFRTLGNLFRQAVEVIRFLKDLFLVVVLSLMILYILSPIDLIPELYFGILGFVDDLIVLLIVVCLVFWMNILP